MPVPAYLGYVVQNGGDTLIIYATADSTPVLSDDVTEWPIIASGGGSVHVDHVDVALAGGSTYTLTLHLTGYVYNGESPTISAGAGWFTTTGGDAPAISGQAVSGTSSKTAGDAITRNKSCPKVAWATRDWWIHHINEAAVPIAIDAIDNWADIEYVEFQFDGAVTVNTDATVTDQGSNLYRVSAKRLVDLCGHGQLPYWYLTLDISAESAGTVATVTEVTVRTRDGVDHDLIAEGRMDERVIRKSALDPSGIRFVDAATGSDSNDGTAGNPWATMTHANSNIGTSVHTVRVTAGTYNIPGSINQSRSTASGHDYVRWEAVGAVTLQNTIDNPQAEALQAFKGFRIEMTSISGTYGILTGETNHVDFEDCYFFDVDGGGAKIVFRASDHAQMIGCTSEDILIVNPGELAGVQMTNLWIHNYTATNGGTTVTGFAVRSLIEDVREINAHSDTDHFSPTSHTDGFHPETNKSINGASYTQATKTAVAVSPTNILPAGLPARADGIPVMGTQGVQGTNVITPAAGFGLNVKSMAADKQTFVFFEDVATADTTLTQCNLKPYGYVDSIIRNVRQYNGGRSDNNFAQNLILAAAANERFIMYNCETNNYMHGGQVVQYQHSGKEIEFVGITAVPVDFDDELTGGLTITDEVSSSRSLGFLVRNCIFGVISGRGATTGGQDYRKGLFGPNIALKAASPASSEMGDFDGSVIADDTVASLNLVSTTGTSPDLRPSDGTISALLTPGADGRRFDINNVPFEGVPSEVGASQRMTAPSFSWGDVYLRRNSTRDQRARRGMGR